MLGCKTPEPEQQQGGDALGVPQGLVLHSATETSLAFQWGSVEGAEGYRYKVLKGNAEFTDGSTDRRNVILNSLESGVTYSLAVCAFRGSEESPYTDFVEGTTIGNEPIVPPSPIEPIGNADEIMAMMLIPAAELAEGSARAFPGAEGCGRLTTGGRGGRVLHVTNLNDSGEGSLRWAIGQSGARTIVFDVAGIIDLKSNLVINKGDVTIAGQSAPGDGICLRNYTLRIAADNVIIRFIRCRMGDLAKNEDDAMNGYAGGSGTISNVIIDHCSMSWSTDECASFYGVKDFTLQYCIISESLRKSIHAKSEHGYGGLWGGTDASYHHNLLAHHDSRNPRFDHDYLNLNKGPLHFYNNVIYNWRSNSGYGGESKAGQEPRKINITNNYYKPGPASSNRSRIVNPTTKCSNCESGSPTSVVPGKFWVEGNYMYGSTDVTNDNWQGVHPDDKTRLDECKASAYQGTRPAMQSAEDAFETVLTKAGASLSRDRIDTRIVNETRNGTTSCKGSNGSTNGMIDSQDDAGGWPVYKASDEQKANAIDSDSDGIPDLYEDLMGLDRDNATDAAAYTIDYTGRKYSNLELYLHYIVRNIIY